jgi:hypothetical protein
VVGGALSVQVDLLGQAAGAATVDLDLVAAADQLESQVARILPTVKYPRSVLYRDILQWAGTHDVSPSRQADPAKYFAQLPAELRMRAIQTASIEDLSRWLVPNFKETPEMTASEVVALWERYEQNTSHTFAFNQTLKSPNCPAELLDRIVHDPALRRFHPEAASNPNCPRATRAMWQLTFS